MGGVRERGDGPRLPLELSNRGRGRNQYCWSDGHSPIPRLSLELCEPKEWRCAKDRRHALPSGFGGERENSADKPLKHRETDEDLLARVARNDAAAVREIVGRKLPRVLALAVRVVGDREEAEDIAQETFIRIWRQAPRWESGRARFDTWLYAVALNLCRDRLRRRRILYTAEPPDMVDPGPLPDHGIHGDDAARMVESALATLPERQREAIVLQYYEELSNSDAAAVMGISVEALESLLARGRRSLRAWLEKADVHD